MNSIIYSDFKNVEGFVIPHKETSKKYINNKLAQTLNKKIVSLDLNVDVIRYTFKNFNDFKLPEKNFFLENKVTVLLSFYAGKSKILEKELKKLKHLLTQLLLILTP